MVSAKPFLAALNVGEVSPEALVRVDAPRIQGAASFDENFIPLIEGGLRARPGTLYSGYNTYQNRKARITKFEVSSNIVAKLEFTDQVMRVFINGVPVVRPSVATTFANGDFSSGGTSWSNISEPGTSVAYTSPTGAHLSGTDLQRAGLGRAVSIHPSSIGTEHAFNIVLRGHPIAVRIGSSPDLDDVMNETTLLPGFHSLAFTPSVGTVHLRIQSIEDGIADLGFILLATPGDMIIPTPWKEEVLGDVKLDQSIDVLFAACRGCEPKRIERRSMRSWSIADYTPDNGPFTYEKPNNIRLIPGAYRGIASLYADRPLFSNLDVGRLIQLTHSGQSQAAVLSKAGFATKPIKVTGIGGQRTIFIDITGLSGTGTKITLTRSLDPDVGFTVSPSPPTSQFITDQSGSATTYNDAQDNRIIYYRLEVSNGDYSSGVPSVRLTANCGMQKGVAKVAFVVNNQEAVTEALEPFGKIEQTDNWRFGDWSSSRGYPVSNALHDGRLFFVRGDQQYGSASDDYSSFNTDVEGDAAPIIKRVGSGSVEGALWVTSLQRLLVGTASTVMSVRSSSFDAPLTNASYTGKTISNMGSAGLSPLKIDASCIYVSKDHQSIIELSYSVDAGDYTPQELTRLCKHLFKGRQVTDMAIQRHPTTRLWFLLDDGQVRCCAYSRQEEVTAWYRWVTDGFVESMTVLPTLAGSEGWLIVRRDINGQSYRMHERVAFDNEAMGGDLSVMSDASKSYILSAPTNTLTGLEYLEGKNVVVWADGSVLADLDSPLTVHDGKINLPVGVQRAIVGLPYQSRWRGSKLAYQGQFQGTAISQPKKAGRIGFVLNNTAIGGLRAGQSFNHMAKLNPLIRGKLVDERKIVEDYDFDETSVPAWSDPDARIHLTALSPYPVTITGMIPAVDVHVR